MNHDVPEPFEISLHLEPEDQVLIELLIQVGDDADQIVELMKLEPDEVRAYLRETPGLDAEMINGCMDLLSAAERRLRRLKEPAAPNS